VGKAGIEGLNRVWADPGALPTLDELSRPDDWLKRTGSGGRAAA
jgi:uncharacterized protein (DUF2342 family)